MVKEIFLYIWQLPQHLLAFILWGILLLNKKVINTMNDDQTPKNVFIKIEAKGFGVSLGRYIFLDAHYGDIDYRHEKGHSRQSIYLGPLYLLVVGIPSAVFNNLWDRLFHKKWSINKRHQWYYSRYPEAWADKLAKVSRGFRFSKLN
jgi:hypothetical protein